MTRIHAAARTPLPLSCEVTWPGSRGGWVAKKETNMAEEQQVTDPVCQMKIKPSEAVASADHGGKTYYFCSQDCADAFRESPEDYV